MSESNAEDQIQMLNYGYHFNGNIFRAASSKAEQEYTDNNDWSEDSKPPEKSVDYHLNNTKKIFLSELEMNLRPSVNGQVRSGQKPLWDQLWQRLTGRMSWLRLLFPCASRKAGCLASSKAPNQKCPGRRLLPTAYRCLFCLPVLRRNPRLSRPSNQSL